jgi:hypothetical protein
MTDNPDAVPCRFCEEVNGRRSEPTLHSPNPKSTTQWDPYVYCAVCGMIAPPATTPEGAWANWKKVQWRSE